MLSCDDGGQSVHQFATSAVRPNDSEISHSAGVCREYALTGACCAWSTKSSTPWRSGVRPVATVVQSMGETIGWIDCTEPVEPPCASALRFGRGAAWAAPRG